MKEIIVLIPHYNNTLELIKSIQSINENQSIDLLIVDDGSKRDRLNDEDVKNAYKNGKVFIEKLTENQGIEHALNHGLKKIKTMNYKYIGRLDCGDICHPNRFLKQLSFLEKNPQISLLGTWANILDPDGNLLFILKHPTQHSEIKKKMFVNSMFIHPSVVYRTSVIDSIGYYPENYEAAEDFAFFFKIVKRHKAANLPEVLLDYIIDENSISSQKRKLQVKNRIRVILANFKFGLYPIYGLIRNSLLLIMSRKMTTAIKKKLARHD